METLRHLAQKLDTEADLRDRALTWARQHNQKPPAVDNVTVPTYLKFCESLGLTPAGRLRLEVKETPAGGNLAAVRALRGQQKSTKRGGKPARVERGFPVGSEGGQQP